MPYQMLITSIAGGSAKPFQFFFPFLYLTYTVSIFLDYPETASAIKSTDLYKISLIQIDTNDVTSSIIVWLNG